MRWFTQLKIGFFNYRKIVLGEKFMQMFLYGILEKTLQNNRINYNYS